MRIGSLFNNLRQQPRLVQAIWAVLALEFCAALFERQWPLAGVALATFLLTLIPRYVTSRIGLALPTPMIVAITLFIFATIFLGEAFDYYNRFWWWDIALHGGSAIGFGLLGFLFVFTLFEGDRYAAPHWALALIAFCVAVTIGVLWEIFEFGMDQLFGMNMQKSGLMDTMGDLIVDVIGASLGALAGWAYLVGRGPGFTRNLFEQFVAKNRRLYRKFRDRD
ncbi:hypothetical protein [Pseudothioclava nitratireducens]|uniref:hypothetical protein n=1 Tax=Pseudothioclava nitratireducens TaxID=1928646 RepID=UPI0023DBB7C4|nr:hypothetical protein [Defluviimonas nitratireducens]MDF1621505.1 hypothetical protein [Defluviimonas nitratireducens]